MESFLNPRCPERISKSTRAFGLQLLSNSFTMNYNIPINMLSQNLRLKQPQSLFRAGAFGLTQTWVPVPNPSHLGRGPDLTESSPPDALLRVVKKIS